MAEPFTGEWAVALGLAPPAPTPTVNPGDTVILNPRHHPRHTTEVWEDGGELLCQIPYGRGKHVVIRFDPDDWPDLRIVIAAPGQPPS